MKPAVTQDSVDRSPAASDQALLQRLLAEPVERLEFDNGPTVVLKEVAGAGLVSIQAWVRTGSIHEGPLVGSGLSHYLEHMLFKGTAKRQCHEISEAIHAFGGYVNAYTSFDRTVYYIESPGEAAQEAIEVLGDMVLHARLSDEDAHLERDVILREIDMGLDDPDRRLAQSLFATAFRHHPYRYPVIGHRALFERVTPDALRGYYHARYHPGNITVVVVGDFEREAVLDNLRAHFTVERGQPQAPVFIQTEPAQLSARETRERGDFSIVRGGVAFGIPGLRHPDSPALDLLASILGNGNSAVLWQRLREERKLVHHVDAMSWNPGEHGLFWIQYLCDPGQREAAEAALFEELQQLQAHGIVPAKLEKARRQALVGEVNARKTVSGQASRLGLAEVVVGDLDYPRIYFERLASVTPEDLARVLGTYLDPARRLAVSLEPEVTETAPTTRRSHRPAPDFEDITLDNGTRLLLQPDPRLPKVHLRLACLGGSLYESAGQRGLTQLLSTLLTRDTARRSGLEVAEMIESLGGSFSDFCGNNAFGFALEGLANDLPTLITLLGEALQARSIHPDTFERERTSQVAEIQEEADEIVDVGRRHLRARFYGAHPFFSPPVGQESDLSGATPAQLDTLAARLLLPDNRVLAVSGDFERIALLDTLGPILEPGQRGGFTHAAVPFAGPAETGRIEHPLDRQQAVVFLAFPDCGITHADATVGDVADEVFSGMSSALFRRVREEKGMAYFVGAARLQGVSQGMFYLYAGTHPSMVEAVLEEMHGELERLRQGGIEPGELKRCQTRLKAQRRMSLQSPGARAMDAALNALYGLSPNAARTYPDRVDTVSIDRLAAFGQHWLNPERSLTLVVGPAGEGGATGAQGAIA
ncbi:MAG: M16 family metallopeptidase [Opitutales bacterium]